MLEDARLYQKIRKRLLKGETVYSVKTDLIKEGIPIAKIDFAIKEFFKDESTDYDDKLIRQIEKRLGYHKDSELIQDIFADLVKKGHKPFEVEKAMLRARIGEKHDYIAALRKWNIYSVIQVAILISTILLGVYYNYLFLTCTALILGEMIFSFARIPERNKEWKTEITVLPYGGFFITQGPFGYNPFIGNYFRWWIFEPATILGIYFTILGIMGGFVFGFIFFLICLSLGVLSYVSYSQHKWDLITQEP